MSTDIISSLGAGSGINIKQLATDLVAAEKAPREKLIQDKIDKTTAEITGYGGLMFVLTELKKTLGEMDDRFDFSGMNVRNSQGSAFEATASASALPGRHEVSISQIAKPQRSLSISVFEERNGDVVSGSAITLQLEVGPSGTKTDIVVPANSTLDGVRDAINSSNSGIRAQVIDSGVQGASDRYRLMITGQEGANNYFALRSSNEAALSFDWDYSTADGTTLQRAQDAVMVVDGLSYARSSNEVTDVIPGTTLKLLAPTIGDAVVQFERDTSSLKTKLQSFIVAYNDVQVLIGIASNPKSDDPDFGGSLAGNPALRSIQSKLRQLIFGTAIPSEGSTVRGLRDLGIKLQDDGSLILDEATFTTNSQQYYDQAVTMLSGSGLQNEFGASSDGIAVRTNKWITEVISARGVLLQNSQSAERRVTNYRQKLTELEARMSDLQKRYMDQFSVMQSIVGQISSMRNSLTSTFEGLASMYKK